MPEARCELLCVDAPHVEVIRRALLGEEAARNAAERARALSEPTRLTLAAALERGEELCVCNPIIGVLIALLVSGSSWKLLRDPVKLAPNES